MLNALLFVNMIVVLATTILGTYLLFRVTISWLLYQIRKRKQGHLGLYNSLSLAPLMHRMKGNANSLTIITVLSAMTLTMLAGAYSLYYSTEKETRLVYPVDFIFMPNGEGSGEAEAKQFTDELERQEIEYTYSPIEVLRSDGEFEENSINELLNSNVGVSILNVKQLQQAGMDIEIPDSQTAYFYGASMYWLMKTTEVPVTFELFSSQQGLDVSIVKMGEGNALNPPSGGSQLVVGEALYNEIKEFISRSKCCQPSYDGIRYQSSR